MTAARRLADGLVGGAALGAATNLFGGMQQRSAAQDANREREKIAKQQFNQKKEYEIGWGQQLTQYAWDQAKTEPCVFRIARKKRSTTSWGG